VNVSATAGRGRLRAYSLYQLRDYWFGPGAGTLLIVFFASAIPLLVVAHTARRGGDIGAAAPMLRQLFDSLVQFLSWVGSLLAVSGLASTDRHPGLARFLFSKPIGVRAYYVQAWCVRGASLLLITAALLAVVQRFAMPVMWLDTMVSVALAWVLIGGVGLLVSVLVQKDAALGVALFAAPTILDAMHKAVPEWGWIQPVLLGLPPTHKLGSVRTALLNDVPVAAVDVWHIVLFGIGSVALATYLVRRMPLVR
jgi:hypothetical protein